MADLDVAVIFILSLLIFSQKLRDILVRLQVLAFELLKPSLGLLHIELFKGHK